MNIRKTLSITQWFDPNCMLFDTFCFKNLLPTSGKVHFAKMSFVVEILGPLIFALCVLPSAARSLKRTKKHRGIEIRFLGPLGPF